LIHFAQSSKKNLSLYTPSFTDKKMMNEFEKICNSGRDIHILIDENAKHTQSKKI
jgi:hypothetical protein